MTQDTFCAIMRKEVTEKDKRNLVFPSVKETFHPRVNDQTYNMPFTTNGIRGLYNDNKRINQCVMLSPKSQFRVQ